MLDYLSKYWTECWWSCILGINIINMFFAWSWCTFGKADIFISFLSCFSSFCQNLLFLLDRLFLTGSGIFRSHLDKSVSFLFPAFAYFFWCAINESGRHVLIGWDTFPLSWSKELITKLFTFFTSEILLQIRRSYNWVYPYFWKYSKKGKKKVKEKLYVQSKTVAVGHKPTFKVW